MKYKQNDIYVKLQKGGSVNKETSKNKVIDDHDRLVQWNLQHPNDKVYKIEDLTQKEKEANPSWIKKIANMEIEVPAMLPPVGWNGTTFYSQVPKVKSTVGKEVGYTLGAVTSPMLLGELGTYGALAGGLRLAAGSAAAAGASHVAGKGGDWLDKKLGTNWIGDASRIATPFLVFPLGTKAVNPILKSAAGHGITVRMPQETFANLRNQYFTNAGNKAMAKAIPDVVQTNIEAGKLGWAPSSKQTLWHNSDQPLTKLEINFPAWDTTQRGAPLGHSWFTGTETTEGFLGARPYHLKGNVELNKPMVQLGEAIGNGKNNTRNQILNFAQKSSADAINFKGIADNTLQNQDVYSVFKNVDLNDNLKLDGILRTRGSAQEAATTYHYDPRVNVLSRPISSVEQKGIIKHERPMYDPEVLEKAKLFAEEYGYPEPKTPEEIKNMYRRHNTFFRTVADLDRTYFPEPYEAMPDWFKQLDLPGQRKILASRGYPSNSPFRGYENSDNTFADGFVFVSPSLEQNADYFINGALDHTVKLQRPFSLRDPKKWHIEADWRIHPKDSWKQQFWPKGRVEIGNASPNIEFKVSTKHLIPVDIAKPDDAGTLLPDYLVKRTNAATDLLIHPDWIKNVDGTLKPDYFGILPEKFSYKKGGKIK